MAVKQSTFGKTVIETVERNRDYDCNGMVEDPDYGVRRPCKNSSYLVVRDENNIPVAGYCKIHARNDWIDMANGDI